MEFKQNIKDLSAKAKNYQNYLKHVEDPNNLILSAEDLRKNNPEQVKEHYSKSLLKFANAKNIAISAQYEESGLSKINSILS